MEATPLVAVESAVADRITEQRETPSDIDQGPPRLATDLVRLMDLAERHARRLVAASDAPPCTLLLARQHGLEVVALDGPGPDTWALPSLLSRREASLAVLMVAAPGTIAGWEGRVFAVVGENVEGAREERHYRVRPCGGTRRLARLLRRDSVEAVGLPMTLFGSRAGKAM